MPARRGTRCAKGHEITGDNMLKCGNGARCKKCEDNRKDTEFAEHSYVDWVRVEYYLVRGKPLPDGVTPTRMELLVAARALRPEGRKGRPEGVEKGIHEELGVTWRAVITAKEWARRHKLTVPTLREVRENYYRDAT